MNLKQQILKALQNPDFPNLKLLYSNEALELAPKILEELLKEEKADFEKKLQTPDEQISFDTFEDFSLLDYYFSLLEHYQGVHGDDTIRKIIEDFEPKYIDFGNEIAYSKRYYDMLRICLDNSDLDKEQKKIITESIEKYEVRGIALSEEKQEELKSISLRLSELSQQFSNNVVDSKKEFDYLIADEAIISEMPEDDKQVARKRAEKKEKTGYLFDASQSSYLSIMKYCSDSGVRKYFYESRHKFAAEGKYSNKENILEILKLRDRRAQILGVKNYAELSLKFKMAESPEQIIEIFSDISEKAKPKAQAEIDEICEYFQLDSLQNWDLSYYANKLREEKYAFDSKELKKYFRFEDVLAGMFEVTKRLYGIEMKKIDIESYSEDIEIYEVYRNGKFLSYFFTDYFYNDLKRPGAWANILREKYTPSVTSGHLPQARETEKSPPQGGGYLQGRRGSISKIVLNVCNFQKGADGMTLLPLSDVETMFHEFGHAIHEMLSLSEHSELSGFHVEWDFVELPSQLLENWCREKQGMDIFARHYKTGKTVPDDMHKKMKQLDTFGNGQMVLTQNTFAMLDMLLHSEGLPKNTQEIDEKVIQNYQQNALLPMGEVYAPHLTFTHIFDGGYAAGYYSYMWAEIIEKEVWKAFKDSGDIFSPEVSQKFLETILSAGSTKKASELFQDFFGRDVEIDAFLQERGLV